MKKTIITLIGVFLCSMFLSSCNEDEPEPDKKATEQTKKAGKINTGGMLTY